MTQTPWARFDDLRNGTALAFRNVRQTLVAHRPADVIGVLEAVQRATEAGLWAFGFVSYEAASALDPALVVHEPLAGLPLAWFGVGGEPVSVPPVGSGALDDGRTLGPADRDLGWFPTWSQQEHRRDVARVRSAIERGDTYQCNLTVRLRGRGAADPLALYRDLALGQRGAYNAYLDIGRHAIASASPELFFELAGDQLVLRPMKGTAPRGRTLAEDRTRAAELRTSAKERAENIMILDLIRNDAARVAEVGSVEVRGLCEVERYETVLQLTSTVAARVRPGVDLTELFRVLFPSGSVTGAPKVRTMELIRELEPTPRGVYCGAIGYVAPADATPRARFSVAIRTAVVDRVADVTEYGVGGGITWSSDAEAEHDELLTKTAVLHRRPREFELFETMRYEPCRGLRNRDDHLRRLSDSAEYFGFRLDPDSALQALDAHLAGAGPARVRLRLRRDGQVAVDLAPLPVTSGLVTLAVDHSPVESTSVWLFHKTSLRETYEVRGSRHPDADDVVLVNERGEVTETTRANLALRLEGRWWTPSLSTGCLPGVERGRLLRTGRVSERLLTLDDLEREDGIAVLSSLRGWCPAVLARAGRPTGGWQVRG